MRSHSNQERIRSSFSVALLVIVYTVYANEFVCVHFLYCHNTISHCIIHQQNNSSCDNAFLHNYILISVWFLFFNVFRSFYALLFSHPMNIVKWLRESEMKWKRVFKLNNIHSIDDNISAKTKFSSLLVSSFFLASTVRSFVLFLLILFSLNFVWVIGWIWVHLVLVYQG